MKYTKTVSILKKKWLKKAHRHQGLFVVLLFLSVVAASSRYFLAGNLLGGPSSGSGSSSSSNPELRSCTSVGTVFEDLETVKEATDRFREGVSLVFDERETYLRKPSQWSCLSEEEGGTGPTIAALQTLAGFLPGWHYYSAFGASTLRPVTFQSFTSILGEFQREYECKLDEFARSADYMVGTNLDLDDPKIFCCGQNFQCVQATPDVLCRTSMGMFEDSLCRTPDQIDAGISSGACPTGNTHEVFATRLGAFLTRIENEKQRARTAMLRSVHALRSFELNYVYAKQLTCFQRASLDLKNELSLLADASSCMPKIWDALTSVHDRDSSLKP